MQRTSALMQWAFLSDESTEEVLESPLVTGLDLERHFAKKKKKK